MRIKDNTIPKLTITDFVNQSKIKNVKAESAAGEIHLYRDKFFFPRSGMIGLGFRLSDCHITNYFCKVYKPEKELILPVLKLIEEKFDIEFSVSLENERFEIRGYLDYGK